VIVLAVLDVNILASGAASRAGLPGLIVDLATDGRIDVAVSDRMLEKLDEVLQRPYFSKRLNARKRGRFIAAYRAVARKKDPDPAVAGVADDEEDDLVLGTAVAAGADVLVTGDRGLLAIGEFRGVRIVTARELLATLDDE
jgi:putative PIN family toxin of toxin-antitoxin system